MVITERKPSRRHAQNCTFGAFDEQVIDAKDTEQGCPGIASGIDEVARQTGEGAYVEGVVCAGGETCGGSGGDARGGGRGDNPIDIQVAAEDDERLGARFGQLGQRFALLGAAIGAEDVEVRRQCRADEAVREREADADAAARRRAEQRLVERGAQLDARQRRDMTVVAALARDGRAKFTEPREHSRLQRRQLPIVDQLLQEDDVGMQLAQDRRHCRHVCVVEPIVVVGRIEPPDVPADYAQAAAHVLNNVTV
ncbi:MAG TPA: hypothetical protein VIA18_25355 [Polyangia bacterium]|nr:hypothetical protein [Polyangia bacterium]